MAPPKIDYLYIITYFKKGITNKYSFKIELNFKKYAQEVENNIEIFFY